MSKNQIFNPEKNTSNTFNQDELDKIYIHNQPENFLDEGEEIFFNIQNGNQNTNQNIQNSLDLPNNKKSHSSSIKTNATFGEISVKENEEFSFFSLNNNNNQNNNLNIVEKKKELTKESIEILNNFISKEKNIILDINNINNVQGNIVNNININIKDIKNNLFCLDAKINVYFKKPYMRKNIKKKKNIIKNMFDYEEQDEDEKIQFDEKDIKMKDIKDDDSKTNNDSLEESSNVLVKKKFQ